MEGLTFYSAVFQITFKGSMPAIDVVLPTSSQVSHLFCWVRWPAFLGFRPETPLFSGTLQCYSNVHHTQHQLVVSSKHTCTY